MFLVQISIDSFIDAEKIDCIVCDKKNGEITIYMSGDNESSYAVSNEFRDQVLNHIQCLNGNTVSIESSFKQA